MTVKDKDKFKIIAMIDNVTEGDIDEVMRHYRLQDRAQAVRIALAEEARRIREAANNKAEAR